MKQKAVFGAGCFWHVQHVFDSLEVDTQVGYMGGDEKKFPNPSYKDVCSGKTGYAEAVYIEYDKKVSYEKLLDLFWKSHDPTQYHRQGSDVGSQYRSVIFYFNDKQKNLAKKTKKEVEKKLGKKVYTEIVKAGKFVRAEEYHQKYYKKHPVYCKVINLFGK
ncbi:MAG: peptide-methionine (S)-S-oxide reductase MsrA [Nanoarchaeota archaeon]